MKKKRAEYPKSFAEHLDMEYGPIGTPERNRYEDGFEVFRLGFFIEERRRARGLTQEQLANKCNTTKSYISRIENGASDIRLSTLMRIIREGLGGRLSLQVEDRRTIRQTAVRGAQAAPRHSSRKKKVVSKKK
jgi:DNA-binding XRE family transcriptional regulator